MTIMHQIICYCRYCLCQFCQFSVFEVRNSSGTVNASGDWRSWTRSTGSRSDTPERQLCTGLQAARSYTAKQKHNGKLFILSVLIAFSSWVYIRRRWPIDILPTQKIQKNSKTQFETIYLLVACHDGFIVVVRLLLSCVSYVICRCCHVALLVGCHHYHHVCYNGICSITKVTVTITIILENTSYDEAVEFRNSERVCRQPMMIYDDEDEVLNKRHSWSWDGCGP